MKTYRYGGCSIPIQMTIYLSYLSSVRDYNPIPRPHHTTHTVTDVERDYAV